MKRLFCLLSLLGVASAQQQPGKGVNFYSCDKEAALGASLASQMRHDTIPFDSPTVADYIDELAQRLAAHMPTGCPTTFQVAIVTDDTILHEPISLPGGYLYVSTTLIAAVQSEAELAGMLAHAMAHVAERHGTRQATRGQLVNFASIPLIFLGGWSGYAVRQGSGMVIPMGMLSLQRQFELAADRSAVQAMTAAGYDPDALRRYIERNQIDPASNPFSTLPARDKRLAALQEAAAAQTPAAAPASDGLAPIQEEVRRLTALPPRRVPSLRNIL
jgi:beta-barrel assembly-enhancing protease